MTSRWWVYPLLAFSALVLLGTLLLGFAAMIAYPALPTLDTLTDYNPKIPLRVFSADGVLIGEFGEERRALVAIEAVPLLMKQAILAAEDERFYQHGGVDYVGVLRAALSNFVSGQTRQGASTITMQVARNFFLTKEKTLTRKFNETLLAFKIERNLNKDQIFQLYINQIYLGQRAYGFAAAAQVYFGKPLEQLSVAEFAMLAGLPKAPSRYNPVINPKRAKVRQLYVLRRMRGLDFITDEQLLAAGKQPLIVKQSSQGYTVRADYLAEMVRQAVYDRYHEDTYTKGMRVYTTLNSRHQAAAYAALRKGALDYDQRHGYRGAEGYIELDPAADEENYEDALQDEIESDDIYPALVLEANSKKVEAYRKGGEMLEISGEGLKLAQRMLSKQVGLKQRIRRGSLIHVQKTAAGNWQIVQLPQIEAALVALDPSSGAIQALVGGFDFNRNQFNHATQALRQPGSGLKPFIYSAALEKGFTPATIVNDAPLMFDASQTGSTPWEPKNYEGTYDGPLRLRTALAKSKNMVSIRVLQAISPQYAQDYLTRFGFDPKQHPPYLTMALGAGSATPLQMASAYAVFANSGYRVDPYFIERIEDAAGKVLARATPLLAGAEGTQRVIDARNAFIMNSLMQEVVRRGTGVRVSQLGRHDLAGKTGTTNDQMDAWFCGYQPTLVAVAWIGFDSPRTLGDNETGAASALPIWMDYMEKALQGVPEVAPSMPEGVVAVNINPDNGLRRAEGAGMLEYFYAERVPPLDSGQVTVKPTEEVKEQLF